MSQFGASLQTAQITTGNVATSIDTFDATKLLNGAKNPLGMKYYGNVTSVANPNGYPAAYRYVRYNSTANAATNAAPAGVWWTDTTYTTVTSTLSEAAAGNNFPAGILLLTSATVTAAQLNGNFVWIQVAGHLVGIASPAAMAISDQAVLTQTDWTTTGGFTRVAKNTAPTNKCVWYAETAVASTLANGFICVESL